MSYYDIGHILNEIYNPESGSIDLFTSYGNDTVTLTNLNWLTDSK